VSNDIDLTDEPLSDGEEEIEVRQLPSFILNEQVKESSGPYLADLREKNRLTVARFLLLGFGLLVLVRVALSVWAPSDESILPFLENLIDKTLPLIGMASGFYFTEQRG